MRHSVDSSWLFSAVWQITGDLNMNEEGNVHGTVGEGSKMESGTAAKSGAAAAAAAAG